ncbi:E3 ubiquitin-protein ligase TRIM22-like [Molossus molossus]|uniref:Tripartite motif containing 22 n=1 Tax=Molossus molossus TaxID=27622 RepID=A0A7J8EVF3_MOLMO|nr:E3 ubiquitin-protein ligase TRIM22-like [Molossus molossus]KAF6439356.1 tripartite motif containing 22 [Molossus molossus]
MAMDSSQVNIKEELICPICMDLLIGPLSLDCGHSFCQACITANKSLSNLEGESRCPVCQRTYYPWTLRPNRQLANIVEKFREVNVRSHQWQTRNVCERHGENCRNFCKEDGKAICSRCVQEHQGHQISPMEEVVKECQGKLQEALKKLTQEQQEAEELEAAISEERDTWKNHMQMERERILKGFEEMRGILDREERKELYSLEEDEVNVLMNLATARDEVVQQRQYMRELISDLQRHMCESSVDMLQDVINVIRRSEIWAFKKPKVVPRKLKTAFQVPDLSGMLQTFKELTEVQSHWVDLMLNPLYALSNVVVSADKRQVTVGNRFMFQSAYPCNFSAFDVLGNQNFSSGKYYWEVDVSGKIAWVLGVYSNTSILNSKKSSGFFLNPNVNYLNVYSRFRPANGYWVVGLQNGCEYSAFEDSSTSDPKVLTLSMAVPPCRVGVFLDYEAGTVSFFNVTNHGSIIYKFSKCRFSQTAYPYFNPWNCPAPMTLCPPSS